MSNFVLDVAKVHNHLDQLSADHLDSVYCTLRQIEASLRVEASMCILQEYMPAIKEALAQAENLADEVGEIGVKKFRWHQCRGKDAP